MSFDQFAELENQQGCPEGEDGSAWSLTSGFVDACTEWSCRPKPRMPRNDRQKKKAPAPANEARLRYMEHAKSVSPLELPSELNLNELQDPPNPAWIAFEIEFTLQTPWYSKDDRPFHVLDNPLRKDRVFGVPFMSAASWKGLLRWSSRMVADFDLHSHLEKHEGKLDGWKDPEWIKHLFGNEKNEEKRFQRGSLAFYPTWFSKIGFEVINPHSRVRRAGTQPIYYEVVPPNTPGSLQLLYAPLPGDEGSKAVAISKLIDAIEALLVTYGFSAKRTVGWGTACIEKWTARRRDHQPIEEKSAGDFKAKMRDWANEAGDE